MVTGDNRETAAAVAEQVGIDDVHAEQRPEDKLRIVEAARAVGARSIAITNDPNSALASAAEISIVPETGAEVIAGSTRMKAGLSQKMVLHLLSTTAMVRLGHVDGNLMTNLMPTSQKLRDRRLRIVMEMTGVDERSASNALDACGGIVSEAARLAKA